MANTPITGDAGSQVQAQKQVGVTLHNMPQVDFTAITDASHPINQANLSGKRIGSLVLAVDTEQVESGDSRISLMIAHGNNPEDGWSALFASHVSGAQWTPVYPGAEVDE